MFGMLDVVDPIVEDQGSSVNPFLVMGISFGIVFIVALVAILLKRKK